MRNFSFIYQFFTTKSRRAVLVVVGSIFALTGCVTLAPELALPPKPRDEENVVRVQVEFPVLNLLEENVTQHPQHVIRSNSSVVINVPDEFAIESSGNEGATNQEFKTLDFFNVAEQQIEKVLLKKGFRVLSRAKFEAKLRALRTEAGSEKELTDISELVRASESGDVRADYILQINRFNADDVVLQNFDLRHSPKVREFIRENQAVKSQFESGNQFVRCASVGATLNAKLIHVSTGEIVWIGEHQLTEFSSGVEHVEVELSNRTYVTNYSNIRSFVARQNTEDARKLREGKDTRVPPFRYRSDFEKTISSGRCENNPTSDSTTKTLLARQVAKELLNTIR